MAGRTASSNGKLATLSKIATLASTFRSGMIFVLVIVNEAEKGWVWSTGSVGVTDTRGRKNTAPAIPPTMVAIPKTQERIADFGLGISFAFSRDLFELPFLCLGADIFRNSR